jgi:hypothetical protein
LNGVPVGIQAQGLGTNFVTQFIQECPHQLCSAKAFSSSRTGLQGLRSLEEFDVKMVDRTGQVIKGPSPRKRLIGVVNRPAKEPRHSENAG